VPEPPVAQQPQKAQQSKRDNEDPKESYELQLQLQPGVSAARTSKKQPETVGESVCQDLEQT